MAGSREAYAELRAAWSRAARDLEHVVAVGASGDRLARAQARLAALDERRVALGNELTDRAATIDARASALLTGAFVEHAVTAMDGRVPFVMLPVRIETRFASDASSLRIRIFPDDIHIDSHVRGLTEAEIELGRWYWERRWEQPGNEAQAEAAWKRVIERRRPARARYLVDVMRPPEPVGHVSGPTFPELDPRPPGPGRAPVAVALPERWAAIGLRRSSPGGELTELFRVWSARVHDDLPVAPDMDVGASADDDGEDGLEWMRDPDLAESMGMLVEVTDADLPSGQRLADGIDRLMVAGADWTRSPDEAAAELDELFGAHYQEGHLSYMGLGTPTNDTGAAAGEVAERPGEPAIVPDDATDSSPDEHSGAARLLAATGLSASALRRAPGAAAQENRWASALVDAVWEATAGYFLGELLDPVVADGHIEALRTHAAEHLHPGGPLPLLRIDRQPYGVLPVVAPNRLELNGDVVLSGLQRTLGVVRRIISPGVRSVPRLDTAADRDDLADVLVELLQRTPVAWSLRARTLHDPVIRFITMQDWTERITLQKRVRNVVLEQLGVPTTPRLDELAIDPRSRPLRLPFVRKGDAGTAYLAEIATAVRADDPHRQLRLRQSSVTVLEALLAFAAVQEIERAATDTIRGHLLEHNEGGEHDQALNALAKRGVRTPTLLRVEERAADGQRNQVLADFSSGRDLSNRVIADITGTATVEQSVARRLATIIDDGRLKTVIGTAGDPHRQLARFTAALDVLSESPLDELEWAFRGVLDCFATRVDAWATSLASKRLADHRAVAPAGAHIGCFGWVEDLRPDAVGPAESLGYIHSPSVAHATATAILRAGRHASDDETFDLAITSHRVREAERILDGLASDQSLASLLGYRIERALRDTGTLGRYILPLRGLASINAPDGAATEPGRGGAGDVVDGLALLERWRTDPVAVLAGVKATQADRPRLRATLNDVDSVFDALSDVLVAESIFQISAGNIDRAGAAMRSHDRPERPTRPEFVRTPPSGTAITHRVIVATNETAVIGWPRDLRHRAEPRLDAWLGRVLGRADEIVIDAELRRPNAQPLALSVELADLGLGPLSLALATRRAGDSETSEFEQLLVGHFSDEVDEAGEERDDAELVIIGPELERLQALCGWAVEVMRSQPLRPEDLLPDDVTGLATHDVDELRRRVDAVHIELGRAHERIVDLIERIGNGANPAVSTLASRLQRSAVFEPTLASPDARRSDPDARAVLTAQLEPTEEAMAERRDRTDALLARVDEAGNDEADGDRDDDDIVELLVAAMHALLGSAQPVLPVFRLLDRAHLGGGIARRDELLDGDDTAPLAWIHKMALVRPALDPFASLLMHAEADLGDIAAEIAVTQWPLHLSPRWYALPHGPDGPPPDGATCIAGHFDGDTLGRRMAGVVVDAWTESIPAPEAVTGLSFHYDAPGARAPQSILLAVHPGEDPDGWDFDLLVDTVAEAIELTHLRAVGPRELGALAGLLPSLFLPDVPSRDGASLPIKNMSEAFAAAAGATVAGDVLGRD
jgi:hypothetical protein